MPLAHLHLLHISPTLSLATALQTLAVASPPPLTLSVPVRWMIAPNALSTRSSSSTSSLSPSPLLTTPWSILVITLSPTLPSLISENLLTHYHLEVGIPSRLLENWPGTNTRLLHPQTGDVPPLSGSLDRPRLANSTQGLELTAELLAWIGGVGTGGGEEKWRTGAVSMLNLLAFRQGGEWKERYARYGKAFGEGAGKRRGGVAKLVGGVVNSDEPTKPLENQKWHEFALAHYPSLAHFADMIGSEDYQAINLKDRVPSLEDTCILFTSEVLVEEILKGDFKGSGSSKAKL